jgi:hypothetical protein
MATQPATPSAGRKPPRSTRGHLICLSCGGELAPPLARLGSLRCHTCRELDAPLDPSLVPAHARAAA